MALDTNYPMSRQSLDLDFAIVSSGVFCRVGVSELGTVVLSKVRQACVSKHTPS